MQSSNITLNLHRYLSFSKRVETSSNVLSFFLFANLQALKASVKFLCQRSMTKKIEGARNCDNTAEFSTGKWNGKVYLSVIEVLLLRYWIGIIFQLYLGQYCYAR